MPFDVSVEDLPPVEDLEVRPHGDQLEIGWKPSARRKASEYVLEWRNGDDVDWQRESRRTTKSLIKGQALVWLRPVITPTFVQRRTGNPCWTTGVSGCVPKSEPRVKKISDSTLLL